MKAHKHVKTLLMTTDTVGGVWTYCMDLCRFLQPYGIHIHLVTMGGAMKGWQRQEAEALQNVTVYETGYALEWMQEPWQDIKACGDYLLQLEAAIQPELVHLNCFAYGALPFKAPVMVVAHSDVYAWFLAVKEEAPPAEWQAYFDCVKKGLKRAAMVVAPSHSVMNSLETIYEIDGQRQVVYNGRNPSLFYERKKKHFAFAMGRVWDEAKNIQLLIEAAPFIHAPVLLAGDNCFNGNSIAIDESGIQHVGKLSTVGVAETLAEAAVYTLPARYEPFGLSAVEAGLSGCALVLGDIPSLKEIWGDAALYVSTTDEKALAATINLLMEDEPLRQAYSWRAKQQAQKYSAKQMAAQYMQAYHQLLQKEKQTFLKDLV